jgi:hypothetical protein
MPRLVIERPLLERVHADEYEVLAEDLADFGWTVIEPRRRYEERSGGGGTGMSTAITVAIHLADAVAAIGVEQIALAVIARLRKPRRPNRPGRQCIIYGPRNNILRTIELDAPPGDG